MKLFVYMLIFHSNKSALSMEPKTVLSPGRPIGECFAALVESGTQSTESETNSMSDLKAKIASSVELILGSCLVNRSQRAFCTVTNKTNPEEVEHLEKTLADLTAKAEESLNNNLTSLCQVECAGILAGGRALDKAFSEFEHGVTQIECAALIKRMTACFSKLADQLEKVDQSICSETASESIQRSLGKRLNILKHAVCEATSDVPFLEEKEGLERSCLATTNDIAQTEKSGAEIKAKDLAQANIEGALDRAHNTEVELIHRDLERLRAEMAQAELTLGTLEGHSLEISTDDSRAVVQLRHRLATKKAELANAKASRDNFNANFLEWLQRTNSKLYGILSQRFRRMPAEASFSTGCFEKLDEARQLLRLLETARKRRLKEFHDSEVYEPSDIYESEWKRG